MSLKEAVLEKIQRLGCGVSFVDLLQIEGVKGEFTLSIRPNLVLWDGVSKEFSEAIGELIAEKRIDAVSAPVLVYMIDGMALNLPIAKRAKDYKKPHWLPATFKVHKS